MKNKRKKWVQHVIAFMMVIAMLLPMTMPVRAEAAENGLYLAYQNTETGKSVVKLKGASAKAVYKVTELNMSKGDSVDLCFINASWLWHNAKWTSDNEKVATVNNDGVITAVGEGIAKITLTYDIKMSKNKESASVTVYIGKDNWKLYIGTTAKDIPESRELKVGRKLDLAFFGVSDWNSGKLFNIEWMSSDEQVLHVDKSTGVITALKPGTAKIGIHLFNKASNIAINDTIEVKVLPMAFSDSTWQNENYLTYGENYLRLFSGNYMFRIPGSVLDKHVLNEYGRIAETPSGGAITESYYNAVTKLSGLDRFLMGTFEFLQNGTSTTVNAIIGGGDTYEDAKRYACILRFVEELHKNENSISSIVTDAAGTTDALNSIYTGAVDLSKTEMMEVLGDSKYLTEIEIKEMVDELYANYDLIGNLVSEGVTITEYIGSAIKLHEVDEAVLYSLSQCTGYGDSLSNALEVLYAEKSKNEVSTVAGKYLSEKAADVINGIINEGTGGASDIIIKAAGKVEEVLHLDMDSYYAAAEFGSYQMDLRFYCKNLLKEINENFNSYTEEELRDKIEAYEFAYEAYITATRMMLEESLKIAKSSEKGKVQASLNALNAFDYNTAVDLAMKYFKMDNPNADEHERVKTDNPNEDGQECIYPTKEPNLTEEKSGSIVYGENTRGVNVQYLQQNLEFLGFSAGYADGIYGNATKNAVLQLQKALYYEQTGCVDTKLDALIRGTVADIQRYLKFKGFSDAEPDGIKGYGTAASFRKLQKAWGYPEKAIVTDAILKDILADKTVNFTMDSLKIWVERQEQVAATGLVSRLPQGDTQEKMDQLLALVGNTYFTTTQEPCLAERKSGHGCLKCNMSDIVKEKWFIDLFGNVNVANFPEHDVNSSRRDQTGQSCFGFACFAQWYLFKADNQSKVEATRVAEGDFKKEFMKANVYPGDVIRLLNSETDVHSVVVYSVEDTGIYVIDSNWSNKLNCYVQKHWIGYNDYYANARVYVNRVVGVSAIE